MDTPDLTSKTEFEGCLIPKAGQHHCGGIPRFVHKFRKNPAQWQSVLSSHLSMNFWLKEEQPVAFPATICLNKLHVSKNSYLIRNYHTYGIFIYKCFLSSTVCMVVSAIKYQPRSTVCMVFSAMHDSTVHTVLKYDCSCPRLSVHVLQVVVIFFVSNYALNYRTFCIFVFLCYRRQSYVCSFFDYQYVGVSKDAGKEWNNRFILFVPFLCGLTSALAAKLLEISSLESQQLLLFQQPKEDLQKVLCIGL